MGTSLNRIGKVFIQSVGLNIRQEELCRQIEEAAGYEHRQRSGARNQ